VINKTNVISPDEDDEESTSEIIKQFQNIKFPDKD